MKQIIGQLRTVTLRQIITVFLAAVTFLVVPAFNHSASLQAQATELNTQTGEYNPVTPDTVKRIQEKAEDFSGSEKDVANTGLENIKQLPQKIPQVIDLNIRQQGAKYNPNEPNKKEAIESAQEEVDK